MNAFSGIISAEFKSIFDNAIDALLYQDACTRRCTMIYTGSKVEPCPNCIFSPIGNKSSNRWKPGGPIPFPAGTTCVMCGGKGVITQTVQEDIYLMVIWDSDGWKKLGTLGLDRASRTAQTPMQFAQTMSEADTWPKLNRINEIILDADVHKELRYQKYGEGELCGLGTSRYVLMTWEKIN